MLSRARIEELVEQAGVDYRHQDACLRALQAAQSKAPVLYREYDAVDLACDTNNYWWTGMENKQVNVMLVLVRRILEGEAIRLDDQSPEVAS